MEFSCIYVLCSQEVIRRMLRLQDRHWMLENAELKVDSAPSPLNSSSCAFALFQQSLIQQSIQESAFDLSSQAAALLLSKGEVEIWTIQSAQACMGILDPCLGLLARELLQACRSNWARSPSCTIIFIPQSSRQEIIGKGMIFYLHISQPIQMS